MSRPKALITGAAGQDGTYLALSLLNSGYEVFGLVRPGSSLVRLQKHDVLENLNFNLATLDITDTQQVESFLLEVKPDEIFNLASHSFVADSLYSPQSTTMVSAVAVVNILESLAKFLPNTRFFQAGSSEMFGDADSTPQNEDSRFNPRNIYGTAKVFAQLALLNYRQEAGLFCSSAIIFNHESPIRSPEFVSRKISLGAAKVKLGKIGELQVGNLDSVRDWGFAPEYVEGMRQIVSHSQPDTFVLATGREATVRDFVTLAFQAAGVSIAFEGEGLSEFGFDIRSGEKLVSISPEFYRPSESIALVGDPQKANDVLGWKASTPLEKIVQIMVDSDLAQLQEDNG
jgi:GDPmannose 4,6-dehydratase